MDDDSFCLFFSGKILLLALCWKKHWHENNHLTFSLCISLEKWYIGRLEGANISSTLYFRFLYGYLIRRTCEIKWESLVFHINKESFTVNNNDNIFSLVHCRHRYNMQYYCIYSEPFLRMWTNKRPSCIFVTRYVSFTCEWCDYIL